MFYSSEAQALREFLRDKLQIPHTDIGRGWLIFDFPEGDLGCHPTDFEGSPPSGTHNVSFVCDNIFETVDELKGRGVKFLNEVQDEGFGLTTRLMLPGGVEVKLYEPRYVKNPQGTAAETQPKPAARLSKAKAKSARRPGKKTLKAKRKH